MNSPTYAQENAIMDIIVINTIPLTITDIVIKLNATSRFIPFFGGASNKFD